MHDASPVTGISMKTAAAVRQDPRGIKSCLQTSPSKDFSHVGDSVKNNRENSALTVFSDEDTTASLLDLEMKFVPTAPRCIPKALPSRTLTDTLSGELGSCNTYNSPGEPCVRMEIIPKCANCVETSSASPKRVVGMKSPSARRRDQRRMQAYLQKIRGKGASGIAQTFLENDTAVASVVVAPDPAAKSSASQPPETLTVPPTSSVGTVCGTETTLGPMDAKIIRVHSTDDSRMHPSVLKRGRSDSDLAPSFGGPTTKPSPAQERRLSDTASKRSPGQKSRTLDSAARQSPGQDNMAFEHIAMTTPPTSPLKANSKEKENHSHTVPPKFDNSRSPIATNSSRPTPAENKPSQHHHRSRHLEKQLAEQKQINGILSKGVEEKDKEIKHLKAQLDQQDAELKRQEIAFAATAHLTSKVRDEKETLARQKQNVTRENSEYRFKNTKLEEENGRLNSEIKELETQVDKMTADKKTLGDRIVELKADNKDLKKDIDDVKGHLKMVRGQRNNAEAEIATLKEERDNAFLDMDKMKEVKLGQDNLANELAKTNGKLQEVRNTRQRDTRAYKTENDELKRKVSALDAVVSEKNGIIAAMTAEMEEQNRTIRQKDDSIQILIKEMGKRPDDSVIKKVDVLQKLSSTIWEMNHSYLKVFKRMGVAKNLNLMDVYMEMKETVRRMTSPDFLTSKVDDDDVPSDLDLRLRKTKESLKNFQQFFMEGRKELSHAPGVKRRHPSDGTSSMSDASDCTWTVEHVAPAKVIKRESV